MFYTFCLLSTFKQVKQFFEMTKMEMAYQQLCPIYPHVLSIQNYNMHRHLKYGIIISHTLQSKIISENVKSSAFFDA